jgi:hypothetical protein
LATSCQAIAWREKTHFCDSRHIAGIEGVLASILAGGLVKTNPATQGRTAPMERFVRRENIKHYRKPLRETERAPDNLEPLDSGRAKTIRNG